jgi:hypothetical protein
MSSVSMRLLKCPACGGPLDPPAGESSMKCTYCGNSIVIPESLRTKNEFSQPAQSVFGTIDTNALVGYGTQWGEVVNLAQSGNKSEAIKKYMALTGQNETDAKYTVDALSGSQSFEFTSNSMGSVQQVYPTMMADAMGMARTYTKWSLWLGCGITAFVMIIILITTIPILIGVFASIWAAFNSF